MYRIAICDDEKTFLEMAQEQIQEYCRSNEIGAVIKKYASAVTLAEDIEAGKMFDAYILDIEMKNYSGLEIARMVKNHSSTACIIFLTSYSSYAVEACGMHRCYGQDTGGGDANEHEYSRCFPEYRLITTCTRYTLTYISISICKYDCKKSFKIGLIFFII